MSILATSSELRVGAGGVYPSCLQAKAGSYTLDTSLSQDHTWKDKQSFPLAPTANLESQICHIGFWDGATQTHGGHAKSTQKGPRPGTRDLAVR